MQSWVPPKKLRHAEHSKTRVEAKFDFTVEEDTRFEIVSDYSSDSGENLKYAPPLDGPSAQSILDALTAKRNEERRIKLERREQMVQKMTPGAREIFRFREFVIRKYGNCVRAWATVFDRDRSGSTSRKEFMAALQEMQYPGNSIMLWKRIDKDHSGSMSLSELAPKSSDELADFKYWARRKYGGLKEAICMMDKSHDGKLSWPEFRQACESNGFNNPHLKVIFAAMDVGGGGTIESDEVAWLDKWDPPQFLYHDADEDMWLRMKERLLSRNRNNAILAWRRSLDKDGSMRLNYDEFLKAVKRMRLEPPDFVAGSMWRALDDNLSGWVSFREFDEHGFNLLGGIKMWATQVFGSVQNMFNSMDANGGGDLTWKEFSNKIFEYCFQYGIDLKERDILYIFNGIDLDGQKRLSMSELQFLEDWDIALDLEEEQIFPKFNLLTATGVDTQELEVNDEQDDSDAEVDDSKPLKAKFDMQAMTRPAKELYWFRDYLSRKFGNLVRAWVTAFDTDRSGVVSHDEFEHAVDAMQFPGDVNGLWRRMDRDSSNEISIMELAPRTAGLLATFKQWASKEFGSMEGLLKQIDRSKDGELDYKEFREACQLYKCPVKKLRHLFNCFDIEENGAIDSQEVQWLDSLQFPDYMLHQSDQTMYANMKAYLLEMSADNAIVAWRRQLDKDSSMRVSWDEFRKAVKRMKLDPYFFSAEKMWNVLDANASGWVSLFEFDQKAYELLGGFKMWSDYTFGSITGMFNAIDKNRGGWISWKEFSGRVLGYCSQYRIEVSEDEVRYLFNGLDLDGENKITLDEVKFLQDWEITVDMEETQLFPNFRLWCRGADILSRPVIASVDRLEDNPKEEESGSRRASVLSQAVELTSRGSVIAPKGWKLANEWEIGQE
jgi:Ca2+-binding EF-hand superfamily protein